MGYSYEGKKLCCDNCGKAGARKYRCPFGYCPAEALCPECRKAHPEWVSKAYHRQKGCERSHLDYQAEQQRGRDLLAAGKWLRVSALWHPPNRVKVIFKSQTGEKAYWMTNEEYDRVGLRANATLDDYKVIGPAKNTDLYDGEDGTYSLTYGPDVPMSKVPVAARRQTLLKRLNQPKLTR